MAKFLVNEAGTKAKLGKYKWPSKAQSRFNVNVDGVETQAAVTGGRYTYLLISGESFWLDGILTEGANYSIVEEARAPNPNQLSGEAFKEKMAAARAAKAAAGGQPAPAAAPKTAPAAAPKAPVAAPKAPVAAPKAPVAAPKAPVAAPKAPAAPKPATRGKTM